ncbi:hypothetical protein [Azospirillum tabaci]|uniref:hypothetical protein n=1 Tax=Azospirillum tabaci TaxID=2752310 RepID=UPI00166145E6|nr:hypothetical protein [Azospirillum tabaci]
MPIKAFALNCTLKRSGKPSSTDATIGLLQKDLAAHGVEVGAPVRVADHDVKPGVPSDEGPGDAWPDLRRRVRVGRLGRRPIFRVWTRSGQKVVSTSAMAARNAAHLAGFLKEKQYPGD